MNIFYVFFILKTISFVTSDDLNFQLTLKLGSFILSIRLVRLSIDLLQLVATLFGSWESR